MINPKTQRFMADRMGANSKSHRSIQSDVTEPDLVIDVILEAAGETLLRRGLRDEQNLLVKAGIS